MAAAPVNASRSENLFSEALILGNWILLLPPSEGKASAPATGTSFLESRRQSRYNSFKDLDPYRDRVVAAVQSVMERSVGLDRIFETGPEGLAEAVELNRKIADANVLPAHDLYTGVMYQAISYGTLKPKEKKLFNSNALIISGMYGVVRPTDRIPPYKLKISANLGGAVGRMVQYWRRPVSEVIRREVRGKIVWDFLPEQHRRVWDGSGETAARHQVKFVRRTVRGGVAEYTTISHHSKALKGALVRYLLAHDPTDPDAIQSFRHPDGYKYSPELSIHGDTETTLVFAAE